MKIYYIFITMLFLSLIFSCQDDTNFNEEQNAIVSKINEIKTGAILELRSLTNNSLDAYVSMESYEYFDTPSEKIACTFTGGFKEGDNLIDAGNLNVNGSFTIQNTSDERYLSNYDLSPVEIFGKENIVRFNSNVEQYSSFENPIYMPKLLNVHSNLGKGSSFYKDNDLILSWDVDNEIENVYLAICAEGVPCILKELGDTGDVTISSSEFSDFIAGSRLSIAFGRGQEVCYDVDEKKVCTYSVVASKAGGYRIK